MKKQILTIGLACLAALSLAACGSKNSADKEAEDRTYTVGVASEQERREWELVAENVKDEGITLKVKEFTDYTQENPATVDGSLDLNAFQTKVYLDEWNKTNDENLVSIGWTYISPLGLYSETVTDYKDIKDGDIIGIPNDVTNGGRAISLLASAGYITLKEDAGDIPALTDIETYNIKIEIETLEASQIAAALPDLTAAVINTNFVTSQLQKTADDAIFVDTDHASKLGDSFKNIVVVTEENKDKEDFKILVEAYQTEEVEAIINESGDAAAW
ncbi:MAG: MetQ/NlpA family ABC transporter substrate-binding protein [Lactovum sp.]